MLAAFCSAAKDSAPSDAKDAKDGKDGKDKDANAPGLGLGAEGPAAAPDYKAQVVCCPVILLLPLLVSVLLLLGGLVSHQR